MPIISTRPLLTATTTENETRRRFRKLLERIRPSKLRCPLERSSPGRITLCSRVVLLSTPRFRSRSPRTHISPVRSKQSRENTKRYRLAKKYLPRIVAARLVWALNSVQYHASVKVEGAAWLCTVVLMSEVRSGGEGVRELTLSLQHTQSGEADDRTLLDALRRRDPDALSTLFARYHRSMVGLATLYLGNSAAAEEVAQDTWLAAIDGLPKFEGRSSLRTWLFHILVKRASKHMRREALIATILSRRSRSARAPLAHRFTADGSWAVSPTQSTRTPEDLLLSREVSRWVRETIASLPPRQREVIYLRDLEGWSSDEVCELLRITPAHQRVLLHRARTALYNLYLNYVSQKGSQPKGGT